MRYSFGINLTFFFFETSDMSRYAKRSSMAWMLTTLDPSDFQERKEVHKQGVKLFDFWFILGL